MWPFCSYGRWPGESQRIWPTSQCSDCLHIFLAYATESWELQSSTVNWLRDPLEGCFCLYWQAGIGLNSLGVTVRQAQSGSLNHLLEHFLALASVTADWADAGHTIWPQAMLWAPHFGSQWFLKSKVKPGNFIYMRLWGHLWCISVLIVSLETVPSNLDVLVKQRHRDIGLC